MEQTGDMPAPSTTPKTYQKPYNLEPNVEAAIAYLAFVVTGVIIYAMEKENKFVRFHALQSSLVGIVLVALSSMSMPLAMIFIFRPLVTLLPAGTMLLWIFLMWKAYNNEEFEVPILGKIAKDQVYKR